MPVLFVHFRGAKEATRIPVGKVDDEGKMLTVKDSEGKTIGAINKDEIAGWWLEPDSMPRVG